MECIDKLDRTQMHKIKISTQKKKLYAIMNFTIIMIIEYSNVLLKFKKKKPEINKQTNKQMNE